MTAEADAKAKILVVDDVAMNVKLLADLLAAKGYRTCTAASGREALAALDAERPDLVLLDVMMPGMSGYEVCAAIRADPAHAMLPIVLVTALDPAQERAKGLDAGADDFLSKPVSQHELLARVRSLLRIKSLYDELLRQKSELAELNRTLERRVDDGVRQLEKVSRLKRFFSPQLAELIVAGGAEDPLKSHRREITVVFLDLRGFTVVHRDRRARGRDGGARRIPRRDRQARPRARGHARALHRRRHHGLLQRPGAGARPGAARGADGAGDAARDPSPRRRLEPARPRARDGRRHRAGLRDDRRHRLPGPDRLRRDRHRHQPRGAAVRRGAGRRDPGLAARLRVARRAASRPSLRASSSSRASTSRCRRFASASEALAPRRSAAFRRAEPGSRAMLAVWRICHEETPTRPRRRRAGGAAATSPPPRARAAPRASAG